MIEGGVKIRREGDNFLAIMEWDPALFTAGYDCFRPTTTGGHASNHCSIMYYPLMAYAADVVPTAITD